MGSTECDSEDEKYGLIKKFSAGCVLKYLYMSQKYIHMWNPKYVIIHNRCLSAKFHKIKYVSVLLPQHI